MVVHGLCYSVNAVLSDPCLSLAGIGTVLAMGGVHACAAVELRHMRERLAWRARFLDAPDRIDPLNPCEAMRACQPCLEVLESSGRSRATMLRWR